VKDQNSYVDIHKLDLSYALDSATGGNIPFVKTTSGPISLSNVTGNTSYFKVRVLFPSNYTITDHRVQLMKLKTDGSGEIDWAQQPVGNLALDASGEALFTTQVKVGDSVGVFITPASSKQWMNNVITVSDAYKAFLGYSQTDIAGTANFFTRPVLEKKVGNVNKNSMTFSEADSYYLFAYVMGQDVSANAFIPTSTAQSWRWFSGLLNQKWLDGTPVNKVQITTAQQTAEAVFAWAGDLDWSHSSHPDTIAARIQSGIFTNSKLKLSGINSAAVGSMAYSPATLESVSLGVTSKLEAGKVILSTNLTKEGLAGLQVIMNYDSTKLTLDNVVFDAGSTVTNFSTKADGRLTFGSVDQIKTGRIKTGTPYKLIFTPKVTLSNTAGLFFFVLADAVDASGKKVELVVE